MLVLLFLFNPVVSSLRAMQQASQLKKVQKLLGCSRAALGSLSEATSVFDPERLPEIIGELAAQLKPLHRDPRLKDVQHALTLVDGSLLSALRTYEMICYYFTGLATEDELLAHLASLKKDPAAAN